MWSFKNICFILIFSLLLCLTKSAQIEEDQSVLVLTDDNFDDALRLHDNILVIFYASWCHICHALAPEYIKAAQTLRYDSPNVKIGKVDDANIKLNDRFQINAKYPTIKMLKNGSPMEYKGGRTAKSIASWLIKNTSPAVIPINDGNEARKLQQSNDVLVLGFFKNPSSYGSSSFSYAAGLINEIFAATSDSNTFRDYNMNETVDGVLILKTFDEQKNVYNGTFDYRDLQTWINANRYPMVTEYTHESGNGFLLVSEIKPRNLLFMGRSDYNYNKVYEVYRSASQEFRGRVLFEIVDTDRDENKSLMEQYNARKNDSPKIKVYIDGKGATQYTSTFSDFTKDNVVQFTKNYLSQSGL